MTNFRDKLNTHLPIVLQFISTASLVAIALSAICGTKSLKNLAESHGIMPQINSKMHLNHHK
ncbi:hypothetical protein [Prochlorococcus sp. MIT 1223]|uniref:hypothetical protein n=1 Tax=Prochlorococcus sp. MIT 1223 TaxID=3096217 RepID=UPI002A74FB0E|nr:hypothetical protein [Prochlorococcus sp. MIT 1223]